MSTAMIHSILNVLDTCIMPIVQGQNHKEMPPLVRTANEIHFTGEESLGEPRDVDEESEAADSVHTYHTGK